MSVLDRVRGVRQGRSVPESSERRYGRFAPARATPTGRLEDRGGEYLIRAEKR